jgi:hypothetical protein
MEDNTTNCVFVDLGYSEPTRIVLIKQDDIREIITLHPAMEFKEVVNQVVGLMAQHQLMAHQVRAKGHPALEKAILNASSRDRNFIR